MAALSDGVTNAEKDENKKVSVFFRDTTVAKMAVDLLKEVCVNPRHGICPSQVNARRFDISPLGEIASSRV